MSACKADTSIERKKGDGPPGLNRLLRTDTIHLAALWELGLAAHIQGSLFCCFVLFLFGYAWGMQKFLGQRADPSHSSDTTRSLT